MANTGTTNTEGQTELIEMGEMMTENDNTENGNTEGTGSNQIKSAFGTSVMNLCNALLGRSILVMAFAMSNMGILLFGLPLTLMAVYLVYSSHLLLKAAEEAGVQAYTELGSHALGSAGNILVVGTVFLDGCGALVSYLYVIKKQMPMVLGGLLDKEDDSQEWFLNENYHVIVVSAVLIFPLCLVKRLHYLKYTSGLSLLCMLFALIAVIYRKFVPRYDLNSINANISTLIYATVHNTDEAKLVNFTSMTAYLFPILAFAINIHSAILPIYSKLKNASRKRMQKVTVTSVVIMSTTYLLIAIFGYLTFYGNVTKDQLLNYEKNDTLMLCVHLAILIAVICSFPMTLFAVRKAFLHLLYGDKPFHWGRHVVVAFVLIILCNILVIFVPNIIKFVVYTGFTTSSFLNFILPVIFYCKIIPHELQKTGFFQKNLQVVICEALGFGILT